LSIPIIYRFSVATESPISHESPSIMKRLLCS
jgi:hypothetical protein